MKLRNYEDADAHYWDGFCREARQSTFLHTRRFLSYHRNKFQDVSLILEKEKRCLGLFPAAVDPSDAQRVISHPGITYGGMIHQGELTGANMIAALEQIKGFYAKQGFKSLLYKALPNIYHKIPSQDDLYALFRLGATRVRCDLTSSINLQQPRALTTRRKRSLKKAINSGIEIRNDMQLLPEFWRVLQINLRSRHSVDPTHTLEEISLLAEIFPENIFCLTALLDEEVVAGVLLFETATVSHAQYIGSNELGFKVSALDAIFKQAIERAGANHKHWFDFGISNEQGGQVLNEGLYQFKSEFGSGGVVHEFYEIDL